MTHSVYTLCGFQNLKPVGFCVFCEFCGNYKQRRDKLLYTLTVGGGHTKSISPINCNLYFYHSIFQMNLFYCGLYAYWRIGWHIRPISWRCSSHVL